VGSATTIFLVRHAAHDHVDHALCGRAPGLGLGETGRRQAAALASRLSRERIEAIHSSPLERAQETARIIADPLGLQVRVNEGLIEIDFGSWTGQSFDTLRDDPRWMSWNMARSASCPPDGESMSEAQARAVGEVERARDAYPEGRLAFVSHGDVIKAILAAYLGLSLDAHARFEIAPASVSALVVWRDGGKVLSMNETVGT
jgi:probable phosphoglycerate mutase